MSNTLALVDRLANRPRTDRIHAFASFLVIRCTGDDLEIHVVGASQSMTAEIVDQVHAAIVGDFIGEADVSIVDHNLDGDESNIQFINVTGSSFQPATGLRVTSCDDVQAMKTLLEATFENVMVAS